MSTKFFGKYRGVVANNVDPIQMGRLRAQVPDLFGAKESDWALPAVSSHVSGKVGSLLPKIGAAVWIEFEQGYPDRPIWAGCFYRTPAETPPPLKNSK
jgi:hypothetical protein